MIFEMENAGKIEQWRPDVSFEDLVKLYYFDAARHERPTFERSFERTVKGVAEKIFEYLGRHQYVTSDIYSEEELRLGNADAALYGYFKKFYSKLGDVLDEKVFDVDKAMQEINGFIMYVHERLRWGLGEELLGISEEQLHALNFIDVSKPLSEQTKIIFDRLDND